MCITGAGAAGIACVEALKNIEGVEVKAFEKSKHCGGVWNYWGNSKSTTKNPMYRTLKTNLPKEIMAFSHNFPFLDDELQFAKDEYVIVSSED